ncbi:MAG: Gfo/Idh/MocA family oxidoreductase [Bacteroidota bacterium]
MKRTIHWGIIGLGKIAKKFAKDIQAAKNAKLYAVASRSLEKAEEFAQEYNADRAFGSYEDLLNCSEVDAVYIATPHPYHHQHTLLCLEAGMPVLCEKPFAINEWQVQEMIDKAKEKKVFLMEALWTQFLPSMAKVKELIAADVIGEVLSVRADFGFKAPYLPEKRLFNRELGGGALLDIGIYPVFLALFLLGYPDEIVALAKIGETQVDEEIGMSFGYKSGQMAHLHSTLMARTNTEAFIYGTKGTIHLPERWFITVGMTIKLYGQQEEDFQTINFDYVAGGFEYEIEEASRCILEGKLEHEKMSWDFSLQLIRLLDAIREKIGLRYQEDEQKVIG